MEKATLARPSGVKPADKAPPAFFAAEVNRDTLTVTFNEALDEDFAPPGFAFWLADASDQVVSAGIGTVTVSGKTVTVTLSAAIVRGSMVTVTYRSPGSENRSLRGATG